MVFVFLLSDTEKVDTNGTTVASTMGESINLGLLLSFLECLLTIGTYVRQQNRMFQEDKRHGVGKFTWPDGADYEGYGLKLR
jgi:MORN repeat